MRQLPLSEHRAMTIQEQAETCHQSHLLLGYLKAGLVETRSIPIDRFVRS